MLLLDPTLYLKSKLYVPAVVSISQITLVSPDKSNIVPLENLTEFDVTTLFVLKLLDALCDEDDIIRSLTKF